MPNNPSLRQQKNNLLLIEKRAYEQGFTKVAGVDEAGRGPLAGPVVAAACVIDRTLFFEGINDSKLLTPLRRKHFFELLTSHSKVAYGVGVVDASAIDRLNIYQATIKAMGEALNQLSDAPDYILVDGMSFVHPGAHVEKVIGGDRRSQSIAAAGIIAKGTRDTLMDDYDKLYPQYGFKENKGYGTKKHLDALLLHGPTPWHRRTFEPLKASIQ